MIFSAQALALISGKYEFCNKNKRLEFENVQKLYLSQYDLKSYYNSTNKIAVVYPIKPKI